jgi:hypothetical protein
MNTLFRDAFYWMIVAFAAAKRSSHGNPWRRVAPIEGDLAGVKAGQAMFAVAVPHRVGNFPRVPGTSLSSARSSDGKRRLTSATAHRIWRWRRETVARGNAPPIARSGSAGCPELGASALASGSLTRH